MIKLSEKSAGLDVKLWSAVAVPRTHGSSDLTDDCRRDPPNDLLYISDIRSTVCQNRSDFHGWLLRSQQRKLRQLRWYSTSLSSTIFDVTNRRGRQCLVAWLAISRSVLNHTVNIQQESHTTRSCLCYSTGVNLSYQQWMKPTCSN